MNDIQQMFREVIEQALELRIPVSDKLYYEVKINGRAKARYGMCSLKNGEYIIEVSDKLLDAPEIFCRSTLAHEILHTCRGCMNHQKKWKSYAALMNSALGYEISVKAAPMEQPQEPVLKYAVKCAECGKIYGRRRRSKLISEPEKYRCVCGGKLHREPDCTDGQTDE